MMLFHTFYTYDLKDSMLIDLILLFVPETQPSIDVENVGLLSAALW